jgi:hypothetical protein
MTTEVKGFAGFHCTPQNWYHELLTRTSEFSQVFSICSFSTLSSGGSPPKGIGDVKSRAARTPCGDAAAIARRKRNLGRAACCFAVAQRP